MLRHAILSSCDHALLLAAFEPGPVYVGCLIFGGGLVALSALGGGHHDTGLDAADSGALGDVNLAPDAAAADMHGDAAGAHGGDAAAGSPPGGSLFDPAAWFSLRFVVYFLAVFGVVGTTLTYMSDMGRGAVLTSALISGVVAGQVVHRVMRSIMRSGTNSEIATRDLVNREARVTVPITPGRRGQVAVLVGDREVYLTATAARNDEQFAAGDRVAVRAYSGGVATVISRREHEFRQETGEGAGV